MACRRVATCVSLVVRVSCARLRRNKASVLEASISFSWRCSRLIRSSAVTKVDRAERSSACETESSCAASWVAARRLATSTSLASIEACNPKACSFSVVSLSFSLSNLARTVRISLSREKTLEPAPEAALRGRPAKTRPRRSTRSPSVVATRKNSKPGFARHQPKKSPRLSQT